jgi:hypothetical protein
MKQAAAQKGTMKKPPQYFPSIFYVCHINPW